MDIEKGESKKEEEQKFEQEFLQDKNAKIDSEEIIRIRKDKIISFFKKNYNLVVYLLLAFIVFLSVKIRTRNLKGLRDITTNGWTLGPDLDPWLFTRWAEYIVEHGKLMSVDAMRYVPLGFNIKGEYLLHPYMMAWFHNTLTLFGWTDSVVHSSIIYPVVMFALTVIALFLLSRRIFLKYLGKEKANIIGLLSAFFLSVMPVFLPRTIAGIPEKESAAFLFMFLAFYFFLESWNSETKVKPYVFAILAALSTVAMANIWGGYFYIFVIISFSVLIAFLLQKIDNRKFSIYATWLLVSLIILSIVSARFSPTGFVYSLYGAVPFGLLCIMLVHLLIYNTKLKIYFQSEKLSKFPRPLISLVLTTTLLILLATGFDRSFVPDQVRAVLNNLIKPATSRLIQTVAENKQPFFNEWASSFGPLLKGIPLIFWLFFVGSIYLVYKMNGVLKKKERVILTISYIVFLSALIFSRYSPQSTLNGINVQSLFLYALGFVVFLGCFVYYYIKYHRQGELEKLESVDFNLIFVFIFFILAIVSARGAIRLVMILAIPASIIVSFFAVSLASKAFINKSSPKKIYSLAAGIILLATVFAGYSLYKEINTQAASYVPGIYNQQWQKAMAWVRENTHKNAVFGHWWDYGYWVQSIGKRATVLDGGNSIGYWNHLMGRHALTGTSDKDALEFLYAHNTTHFLIDSSDIGKYSAFSYIGSDENLDRRSFITSLYKDNKQTAEKKNSTVFVYIGGTVLDEDIFYEENGSKIFLPSGQAGLGGILIERNSNGEMINNPIGIFAYKGKQYNLPLRYVYDSNDGKLKDLGSGIEGGLVIYPRAVWQTTGNLGIENDGAALYLSKRVVNSQLARFYLYKEKNENFVLVHSEDDFIIAQIKAQNPAYKSDFLDYAGFRGPIRIWEINYPKNIEFKEEYLSTEYPAKLDRG